MPAHGFLSCIPYFTQVYTLHTCGKDKKLCVRGDSRCVQIPIWGTLSSTYVWRWRSVEQTSCLLVLVFVTLVLDTLCSTGTFVYCIRRSLQNRRPVCCYSHCGAGFFVSLTPIKLVVFDLLWLLLRCDSTAVRLWPHKILSDSSYQSALTILTVA